MSAPRLFNQRGQFIPITLMLIISSLLLLMVVSDIYHVTHAKLEAQNMADSIALAVAALEAKNINVVLDRNEWLNHLYPDSVLNGPNPNNGCKRLPPISLAAVDPWKGCHYPLAEANAYAQLVQTVNQAQGMFSTAYNQFLGAGQGTSSQNSGAGSLAEILSEIDGLNNASSPVRVIVFNTSNGQSTALQQANQMAQQPPQQFVSSLPINTPAPGMAPVAFTTQDVNVNIQGANKPSTLTQLMYGNNPPLGPDGNPMKVGWMSPNWTDSGSTMQVNVQQGQTQTAIGAGAIVIKLVPLNAPFLKQVYVQAKAVAYVVQKSGISVDPNSPNPQIPSPPTHFRPTYYVQLGYL